MINISGTFTYQPPVTVLNLAASPATVFITLVIVSDDGVPVFDDRENYQNQVNDRLTAQVVQFYPQGGAGLTIPLALTPINLDFPANYVALTGVNNLGDFVPGLLPAAILIILDATWSAIITAAAPAVPNTGIAPLVGLGEAAEQTRKVE
jgi:hypothetical protein